MASVLADESPFDAIVAIGTEALRPLPVRGVLRPRTAVEHLRRQWGEALNGAGRFWRIVRIDTRNCRLKNDALQGSNAKTDGTIEFIRPKVRSFSLQVGAGQLALDIAACGGEMELAGRTRLRFVLGIDMRRDVAPEYAIASRREPLVSDFSGSISRISSSTWSVSRFSAWASKFRITRCRSAGK